MEIQLFKALKAYDWSAVDLVLTTAESRLPENQSEIAEERQYHIDKLRNYLARNWDYIKPMAKRQLPLSKGIGVCETGHRYYSYRLKRQGRVWTEAGTLNAIKNNEFIEGLTSEIDPVKLSLGDDIKSALKNISTTSVGATYGTHCKQWPLIKSNRETGENVQLINQLPNNQCKAGIDHWAIGIMHQHERF